MNFAIPDDLYRNPKDCVVSPANIQRVAMVGSCLISGWPAIIELAEPQCSVDYIPFNFTNIPVYPQAVDKYDFQICSIPLRSVIPDGSYFSMHYSEPEAWQVLLDDAITNIGQFLEAILDANINHGMLTFVCNFMVPQQNPLGRLLPRYDLRNMVYFIERLNLALSQEVDRYNNCYIVDNDAIAASIGRRYVQDDVLWPNNHGSALMGYEFDLDQNRIEIPIASPTDFYPVKLVEFISCVWCEIAAMYRTLMQRDAVKLVLFDVDDTLWRGVAAEKQCGLEGSDIEGWPLGVIEAMGFLKRRGIMIALVSKNTESVFVDHWNHAYGTCNRFKLQDFVTIKINWLDKHKNIEDILNEVNILPQNVLFIDDNPVERAVVKEAFPEIRVLGSNPYVLRRILLWAAELQVAQINEVSAKRTEMIQAQISREDSKKRLSRSEFLAGLNLKISFSLVSDLQHPKFQRAMELLNKTNQFNTAGVRYSYSDLKSAIDDGVSLILFDVSDRFTNYGTVGVIVWKDANVSQFVMSCRVFGLDIELAVLSTLTVYAKELGFAYTYGHIVETDKNLLCRSLFKSAGFSLQQNRWQKENSLLLQIPAHIDMNANALRVSS